MRMSRRNLVGFSFATPFLLTACGGDNTPEPTPTPEEPTAVPTEPPPALDVPTLAPLANTDIHVLGLSPDGSRVLGRHTDGSIGLWDPSLETEIVRLPASRRTQYIDPDAIAWDPADNTVYYSNKVQEAGLTDGILRFREGSTEPELASDLENAGAPTTEGTDYSYDSHPVWSPEGFFYSLRHEVYTGYESCRARAIHPYDGNRLEGWSEVSNQSMEPLAGPPFLNHHSRLSLILKPELTQSGENAVIQMREFGRDSILGGRPEVPGALRVHCAAADGTQQSIVMDAATGTDRFWVRNTAWNDPWKLAQDLFRFDITQGQEILCAPGFRLYPGSILGINATDGVVYEAWDTGSMVDSMPILKLEQLDVDPESIRLFGVGEVTVIASPTRTWFAKVTLPGT